jgi:lysophospholipase L1-like esterase
MKRWIAAGISLTLAASSLGADEPVVTLGDSLTFAYEAEFGFQRHLIGLGTVGDGMPATVKNWIEILSDPAYRGSQFALGTRKSISVDLPLNSSFQLFLRQNHNWAIPGLKADGLRKFVQSQATFLELLSDDPDFEILAWILRFSNFDGIADFSLTDLEQQIREQAKRVVIGIGGNDARSIYGTVYNGGSAGKFVEDFVADLADVITRVQTLNPTVQIVLINVPHVGITPNVRESHPYDPLKTGRVSAVLGELNQRLATLAADKHIGYADVYTPTLKLLDPANPLCIDGIPFPNIGTTDGAPNPVWLNGPLSDNFHPNTNAQTVIANAVIHAFNRTYQAEIAPLSATETLVNLLGKDPAAVDMTFVNWMSNFGLANRPTSDDSDGDGIPAGMEFAIGMNPTLRDSESIRTRASAGMLEIRYRTRLPASQRYSLTAVTAETPAGPYAPLPASPPNANGLLQASIPIAATPGFLRLKAEIP